VIRILDVHEVLLLPRVFLSDFQIIQLLQGLLLCLEFYKNPQ
jgi:hypothetical protein